MFPVNKKSPDYNAQKNYIGSITKCLIPHVKEKSIAEIIVNTALQIEKTEISHQLTETTNYKNGSFGKIHNTLKLMSIVMENNTDLKMEKIREDTKRLLREMIKCFDNQGLEYFNEHKTKGEYIRDLKYENRELKEENEYMKRMLERFNIVDVDDLPSDTDM